jgi:hypothetical protein
MLDLDAIEARAEAATPGPWIVSGSVIHSPIREPWDGKPNAVIVDAHIFEPNADFIAASRTDTPALVAELRAARADLGLVHLALQHDRDCEEEGEGECCLSHWRSIVIAVAPDLARNVTGQELADLAAYRAVVGEQE